jgi:hypothetical protein
VPDEYRGGFDDAAATFRDARTISVSGAPLSSEVFADALREFCGAIPSGGI